MLSRLRLQLVTDRKLDYRITWDAGVGVYHVLAREYAEWARGYKQIRMEFFYRMMRKRYDIMMEGDKPLQGRWNFDTENRGAFPKTGPGVVPGRLTITPARLIHGRICQRDH